MRKSENRLVMMVTAYRRKYGLAEESPDTIRKTVLSLSTKVEASRFVVPFAADVLGVTLPVVKSDFDELMRECSDKSAAQQLERRAQEALEIFWQARLFTKGWSDDVGESLTGDIRLVIKFLGDTHKPWND